MSWGRALVPLIRRLDRETRGLAKDSLLLGIGKAATTVGMATQVALISHILGLRAYGVFSLTVAFVALVDRFFDVDVGRAAIAFGTRCIARDKYAAAGVFQFTFLIDLGLGLFGFAVAAACAPIAGPRFVGDQGTELFLLLALTLLGSTVDITSSSTLQVLDRYRELSLLVIFRETTRVLAICIALFMFDGLIPVVVALVIHDFITGAMGVRIASRAFARAAPGVSLLRPWLGYAREFRRPMLSMIFQTNLVGYAKLAQSQLPALLLGLLRDPLTVGVFKIGMAAATVVGQISDPAWNAVMPRLARLWHAGRLDAIRKLILQGSLVAVAVMVPAVILAISLRTQILVVFGGAAAGAAGTIFALGAIAKAINGITFWNDSLLYAANRAKLATAVFLPSTILLLVLVWVLSSSWGATGAGVAVLVSTVVSNLGLSVAALWVVHTGPEGARGLVAHSPG
jgi:O-antigen/teichoic acid export membrane protein